MNAHNYPIRTAADVVAMLDVADLPKTRRRDLISAINRVCEMNGISPISLRLEVPALRAALDLKPAAHGISAKAFSNIRSAFVAAMSWAYISEPGGRGRSRLDPVWSKLAAAASHDKGLATGLAAFMNWCSGEGIAPADVNDEVLRRFSIWLETRTLHPKPRIIVWSIPPAWNKAVGLVPGWPPTELARVTFRAPSQNLRWDELSPAFRSEAEAYLDLRRAPDIFDTDPGAPKRPLAASTLRQQQEHIRLAASILVRQGRPVESLATVADLVEPAAFKTVLRHYHKQAMEKASAFAIALAKTLIDVGRYQLKLPDAALGALKAAAAKLPAVPLELTEKNKALLAQLESDHTKAQLLFLPDKLIRMAEADLKRGGRMPFVKAQMAIAIAILLVAPLRPQNLITLNWRTSFREPNGPKGILKVYVPKGETKSRKRDIVLDIPADVAAQIRWYRREILSRIGADSNGPLFVTQKGVPKSQETLSQQITETIAKHVGVHMTPHQFRHFAASLYLEQNPGEFQTVTDLLGHAWSKTTLIYAGSSSSRASRAYGNHVLEQREALKLARHAKKGKSTCAA